MKTAKKRKVGRGRRRRVKAHNPFEIVVRVEDPFMRLLCEEQARRLEEQTIRRSEMLALRQLAEQDN